MIKNVKHFLKVQNKQIRNMLKNKMKKSSKKMFIEENESGITLNQASNIIDEFIDKGCNKDSIIIDPGNYRTYIAPAGVSDILDMFSWNCIGEASIQQGQSALIKLRENKKLSNCFSLEEDFSSGFVPRFNSMGEIAPEVLNIIDWMA